MAARRRPRIDGEVTRARLFEAALRLFVKNGYAATSVEQITREAGVGKGTFFVHFATKDAVVTQVVRDQVRSARSARDRAIAKGGTPIEALRATVMALAAAVAIDRELSRVVIAANMLNPALGGFAESVFGGIFAEMMDDVRSAQRLGLLDPAVEAETIAGTLLMSYFGAALLFATAPSSRPMLELLAPVVEANLAGFSVARRGRHRP